MIHKPTPAAHLPRPPTGFYIDLTLGFASMGAFFWVCAVAFDFTGPLAAGAVTTSHISPRNMIASFAFDLLPGTAAAGMRLFYRKAVMLMRRQSCLTAHKTE